MPGVSKRDPASREGLFKRLRREPRGRCGSLDLDGSDRSREKEEDGCTPGWRGSGVDWGVEDEEMEGARADARDVSH